MSTLNEFGIEIPEEEPWKDPDVLVELYHEKGLDQSEVGEELGVSAGTISYWMNKLGINTSYTKHSNRKRLESVPCVHCSTEVPGNGAICAECLDEVRYNDR